MIVCLGASLFVRLPEALGLPWFPKEWDQRMVGCVAGEEAEGAGAPSGIAGGGIWLLPQMSEGLGKEHSESLAVKPGAASSQGGCHKWGSLQDSELGANQA